jgi:hypothetical protein
LTKAEVYAGANCVGFAQAAATAHRAMPTAVRIRMICDRRKNDRVASPPVTIRIGPEPAALTLDQEAAKANLMAQYAVNTGDLETAALAIGDLLASQRDNVGAMATNARLLEQAGLTWPAFFQAGDAFNAFFQNNPAPAEMPHDLLTLYQELLAEIQTAPSDTSGQSRRGVRTRPRVR